ncbi:hypothetical protein BvCmsSIP060_01423 [Escherichia coli]|nr:hypothetical protein G913_00357 [Escherichia coli UMEA 3124-1]GDT27822.1 hypothetical protein BvCmsSINP040_01461 [Escherichia coli]GDU58245.1 hypothetical protein BvCmsSIP060_01423 [Escherichia coli]STM35173.1 Uncharacterised protein [Escherichia coli]
MLNLNGFNRFSESKPTVELLLKNNNYPEILIWKITSSRKI